MSLEWIFFLHYFYWCRGKVENFRPAICASNIEKASLEHYHYHLIELLIYLLFDCKLLLKCNEIFHIRLCNVMISRDYDSFLIHQSELKFMEINCGKYEFCEFLDFWNFSCSWKCLLKFRQKDLNRRVKVPIKIFHCQLLKREISIAFVHTKNKNFHTEKYIFSCSGLMNREICSEKIENCVFEINISLFTILFHYFFLPISIWKNMYTKSING